MLSFKDIIRQSQNYYVIKSKQQLFPKLPCVVTNNNYDYKIHRLTCAAILFYNILFDFGTRDPLASDIKGTG